MTRVLQAIAGGTHGGAEEFFVRLCRALGHAGLDQKLVVKRGASWASALGEEGLDPFGLPFGGMLDFTTRPALRREIEAFRPEVVLTWMSRASNFCRRGRGWPAFVHVARLGGYYDLKYYRHCDHLIGDTHEIVQYLIRSGWPEEKTHYLPNFVDAQRRPAADRGAFETPAQAPLLLALGRLHRHKGFDVLIEALARMPDCYLWLGGDGPLKARLAAQAEASGVASRLRFLGWHEDVAALYAAADVLVCPSRLEPLANVIIEAWAQDVPVVAAASVGPAGLIESEETGLLVPVGDSGALAEAIGRVIADRDLAARLTASGRANFETKYTEDAVVGQYLDFFEQVKY